MKLVGYVAASLAASCVLAAGSAWADSSSFDRSASDTDISREIASNLIKDTAVGPNGVTIRSRNGMVQMNGSVGNVKDWKKAYESARSVAGVEGVQNDLNVLIR